MSYLENDIIRLRAVEPEDLIPIYEIENNSSLWWVGSQTQPYSRFMIREYISKSTGDIYSDQQLRLMIERKSDGRALGMVDLFSFAPRHRRAELGIVVFEAYRKQGYAHEALQLISDYAHFYLALHQLYVYVPAGNAQSIRLFSLHGFTLQHLLKEWIAVSDGFCDVWLMQKIL